MHLSSGASVRFMIPYRYSVFTYSVHWITVEYYGKGCNSLTLLWDVWELANEPATEFLRKNQSDYQNVNNVKTKWCKWNIHITSAYSNNNHLRWLSSTQEFLKKKLTFLAEKKKSEVFFLEGGKMLGILRLKIIIFVYGPVYINPLPLINYSDLLISKPYSFSFPMYLSNFNSFTHTLLRYSWKFYSSRGNICCWLNERSVDFNMINLESWLW